MRAERSAGSGFAKTTPLIARNSEISTVEADQDHEAAVAHDRPQRCVAVEVQDERVDDLVRPIHQPERQAREHDAPVRALDLDRVHVHGQRQQRDRRPVEQARGAPQVLGSARELGAARRELPDPPPISPAPLGLGPDRREVGGEVGQR